MSNCPISNVLRPEGVRFDLGSIHTRPSYRIRVEKCLTRKLQCRARRRPRPLEQQQIGPLNLLSTGLSTLWYTLFMTAKLMCSMGEVRDTQTKQKLPHPSPQENLKDLSHLPLTPDELSALESICAQFPGIVTYTRPSRHYACRGEA